MCNQIRLRFLLDICTNNSDSLPKPNGSQVWVHSLSSCHLAIKISDCYIYHLVAFMCCFKNLTDTYSRQFKTSIIVQWMYTKLLNIPVMKVKFFSNLPFLLLSLKTEVKFYVLCYSCDQLFKVKAAISEGLMKSQRDCPANNLIPHIKFWATTEFSSENHSQLN